MGRAETLVSVDVEASGPSPSTGSLVAVGACLVDDPATSFYLELRPVPDVPWHEETEPIHGLTRGHLERHGRDPREAMESFAAWLSRVCDGTQPVLVSFNAPFDWMFVADYFHRFLGRNPFGISGLDAKAYYMGKHGVAAWAETSRRDVRARYPTSVPHTHNALEDAQGQAELMRRLRDEPRVGDAGAQ